MSEELGVNVTDTDTDTLLSEIARQEVKIQQDCINAWTKTVNTGGQLTACAACGIRMFATDNTKFHHVKLTSAKLLGLRYTEAELLAFENCSDVYKTLKSSAMYCGNRYHLHPELVTWTDDPPSMQLCSLCHDVLPQTLN